MAADGSAALGDAEASPTPTACAACHPDPVPVSRRWAGGPTGKARIRNSVMATGGAGVVALSWYDARDHLAAGETACFEAFFTASLDGGESFLEPVRVSGAHSCPHTAANGTAGERWPAGGDYSGLVYLGDDLFRLLWADSRDGTVKLRTATVRIRR